MYHNPRIRSEINKRARNGRVVFLDHARVQMVERDILDIDVLKCLKTGIIEGEDWNPEHQEYTWRMAINQGRERLIVVVAMDATDDLVVTTFRS